MPQSNYLSIKLAKYVTANSGDITNLSQDLDSTVETIYYEEGAEKIRELEQKIACLEKYIKELETSVHLHRTQNSVSVTTKLSSWAKLHGWYVKEWKQRTEKGTWQDCQNQKYCQKLNNFLVLQILLTW